MLNLISNLKPFNPEEVNCSFDKTKFFELLYKSQTPKEQRVGYLQVDILKKVIH